MIMPDMLSDTVLLLSILASFTSIGVIGDWYLRRGDASNEGKRRELARRLAPIERERERRVREQYFAELDHKLDLKYTPAVKLTPELGTEAGLQALCRQYVPLFNIPEPLVAICQAECFSTHPYGRALAHFVASTYTIEINAEYLQITATASLINTIKHELIHAWIYMNGIEQSDWHDEVFQKKARQVDVH